MKKEEKKEFIANCLGTVAIFTFGYLLISLAAILDGTI
jgi:hypothetical protein|tara:strand:- start:535 stop:648 length:114 start_codon:yes stop_codon:yes gene_type:complete